MGAVKDINEKMQYLPAIGKMYNIYLAVAHSTHMFIL